jgi:negative regulator of sigma E activity
LEKREIKCWLIRVNAPDVSGPYYTVDLWVHKDSGGMAKMEAYDRRGKMVKRFEVRKMQKVDGATALKEMMVESLNQTSGDVKGRTYMTLDAPVKQN